MPQKFRTRIDQIVHDGKQNNRSIRFVDTIASVDQLLDIEDKWLQFQKYSDLMPDTQLFHGERQNSQFVRPVYKKRLSSRGAGVTWDSSIVFSNHHDWVVQESIDIKEELRVYLVAGSVYPIATVRSSKTSQQRTKALTTRYLSESETVFCREVADRSSSLDFVGIDIARDRSDNLYLIEVNRSPGFSAFFDMTHVNLAQLLYRTLNLSAEHGHLL